MGRPAAIDMVHHRFGICILILDCKSMTDQKRIQSIEEKLDRLADLTQQAIIAARESTTPSFSDMVSNLISRMEAVESKLDIHMERTQPVVDTIETAERMKKAVIWISGFLLALYPITHAFSLLKEWLKK